MQSQSAVALNPPSLLGPFPQNLQFSLAKDPVQSAAAVLLDPYAHTYNPNIGLGGR